MTKLAAGRAWRGPAVAVVAAAALLAGTGCATPAAKAGMRAPLPAGGYFRLVPPGHFGSLPSDRAAAARVHRSGWEPRPANTAADNTIPPTTFRVAGYSGMLHHAAVFGRVTGHYRGTTDEIIQWAAVKWGLPDNLVRAEAVVESDWYQNLKHHGSPVPDHGYGDFGVCGGSPGPSGYGASGPASFGIMQVKWCDMKDQNASGYGPWPWSERSTAFDLDFYGAVMRGCLEGWDTWLGAGYHAGQLWTCVSRWYAGSLHNAAAATYVSKVQAAYRTHPWLGWRG